MNNKYDSKLEDLRNYTILNYTNEINGLGVILKSQTFYASEDKISNNYLLLHIPGLSIEERYFLSIDNKVLTLRAPKLSVDSHYLTKGEAIKEIDNFFIEAKKYINELNYLRRQSQVNKR